MALATTCPLCKTSFKVVPDQLKLRRGLVRCGACQHVFSGIDFLRYVDESKQARPDAAPATMQPAGEGLQTAFFLPETILVTPPIAPEAGVQPPVRTPEAESPEAESPESVGAEPVVEYAATEESTAGESAASADGPAVGTAEADLHADALLPTAPQESPPPVGFETEGAAPDVAADIAADIGVVTHECTDEDAVADTGEAAFEETGDAANHADAADALEPESWRTTDDTTDAIVAWGAGTVEPVDDEREQVESLTATTPTGFVEIDTEVSEHDRLRVPYMRSSAATSVAAVSEGVLDEVEDESAIDYFSSARRGIGFVDRHGPLALAVAALLALLLGAQWSIAERSMIAARVPVLAPALSAVLAPFGLDIGLPRDLGSLTIESFELRASDTPGVLAMSAILRNRADYGVQWPSMQLTLTDAGNRVLARKVLGPDDYLRESRGGEGLPPRAEWPVRLALEADDLQPAGYSVVLFYP